MHKMQLIQCMTCMYAQCRAGTSSPLNTHSLLSFWRWHADRHVLIREHVPWAWSCKQNWKCELTGFLDYRSGVASQGVEFWTTESGSTAPVCRAEGASASRPICSQNSLEFDMQSSCWGREIDDDLQYGHRDHDRRIRKGRISLP